MSKLSILLLSYLTEIWLIRLIHRQEKFCNKKGKLEETSHRSNSLLETYQFQLHYFSIGNEWEMERENWNSNFKGLLSSERKTHFKMWEKKPPNPN